MRSRKPIAEGAGRGASLETMPSFLLNHIVHKYHQILQSKLRSTGVSTLQMRIILSLHAHDRLTVSELCNYAIAEQPTMSRALDSLESQGLVRRQMSETDSRLRLVSLTEKGIQVHARIHPVVIGINEAIVDGLSDDQRTALLRQLGTLLVNLDRV